MNRRDFMWRLGLGAGAMSLGAGLLGQRAQAQRLVQTDRYFIFCYFAGGWDHLLGLDPRDPRIFTDDARFETGIQPAYDRIPARFSRTPFDAGPFSLGPCAAALVPLAEHFSVVRGINMATLTHEVGRRYFITGRQPAGLTARGSSVATIAASQLDLSGVPVPHLAHGVESYNVDLPAAAGAMPVAAVGHLRYILQENLGIPTDVPPNVKGALAAHWAQAPVDAFARSRKALIYAENRQRAREVVISQLYSRFAFDSPETAAVRAHYGFAPGNIETPFGRAALAATALKSGLSRVVSVVLADGLDTHDGTWANDHSTRLDAGFTALARLIEDLRDSEAPSGGSLLSKTTLVAFSEFGRTARLNERNGRDHLLGNSALLAGAGINGGQLIGSSSDRAMGPELIDLGTGRADEAGISLTPEHVMTTALKAAGMDASSLRSAPIPGLLG